MDKLYWTVKFNSEEWLKDKLDAYGKDPIASLHDMLFNANEVLYMALNFDSPHTAKGIIKSAYENNINFLSAIGYLEKDKPNG
jgi:uncharacterized protein YpiB (UPF0302 family)